MAERGARAAQELGVQTVIFDDELSPGQQRSLERVLGDGVRLADRTALILDIFGQRAATKEGQLQAPPPPPCAAATAHPPACDNLRGRISGAHAAMESIFHREHGPDGLGRGHRCRPETRPQHASHSQPSPGCGTGRCPRHLPRSLGCLA